jgi:hypothetical protein
MADNGCTLSEIKSVTGHKSDSVCQSYIQNSMVQKKRTSEAIAVSECSASNTKRNKTDEEPFGAFNSVASSGSRNIYINSITVSGGELTVLKDFKFQSDEKDKEVE